MRDGTNTPQEVPSASHCPLCRMFPNDICTDCPVKEATGYRACVGTPYVQAWQAWESYGLDSGEFRESAQKEIEFLQSLLPKNKHE